MELNHKLGEYIYMGMGLCNNEKVNIAVAYKPDYCVKKSLQFEKASNGVVRFEKIHKVRVGSLVREESISRQQLVIEFQHIFKEYNG